MFYMHDIGWGWEFLMAIGMIAFWALVIYGIVWIVRGGANTAVPTAPTTPSTEMPLEILDRRLASGQITVDEYHELREALEHKQQTPV